jgi:hypothetical protein
VAVRDLFLLVVAFTPILLSLMYFVALFRLTRNMPHEKGLRLRFFGYVLALVLLAAAFYLLTTPIGGPRF